MRSFTVQIPPGAGAGEAVVLKEGFCWWAVLFGPLWFLWHKLWVGGIALAVLQTGLTGVMEGVGVSPLHAAIPSLGVAVLVGFSARDWWRWRLERAGYRFAGVIAANSLSEAEWRWLAQVDDPAGALA